MHKPLDDTVVAEEEALSGFHAQMPTERPRQWRIYWRRLKKRPAALVGTIIFCCFLFLAVFGPWVAPYNYAAQSAALRLHPPTLAHPFGTDDFGRDILSRVIVGTRNVFLLGGVGTFIAVLIGTAIGLASGYVGGTTDEVVMRLLDVLLSFPSLLLALVLLSTVGPSNLNLVLVVAVLYIPMVHGTEIVREGYFGSRVHAHYDLGYILPFCLVLTFVALFTTQWVARRVVPE